ncbi:AAA family ATPase [Nonomuraea fastidiosa]|jgi:adenylylsulfate kinase-like enzyme|uniref:AAA family ATPase n=1 Tax=Nonomuraea fastidiosa TaxID=46173 RepID=UPI0036728F11
MNTDRLPLLWLSGPSGVGKSSAAFEICARLGREGVKAAFVDADQIGLIYPAPEENTHRLRARNLAALWEGFREEGVECLVLAGFVDTPEEVREYTSRLPDADFTVCRLRVSGEELRRRFLGRGWMPGLVEQAVAEAEAQERSAYADLSVDTGGLTVRETARLIMERAGRPRRVAPVVRPGRSEPGPMADGEPVPLLWFTGATAVGKSTVAYEVFRHIVETGARAAYVDLKQIATLRPASGDLRDLKARNLAALWAGYRAAGATYLIVCGEADTDETVRDYTRRLSDVTPTVCRLHACPATLLERVTARGRGEGPTIPGDELKGLDEPALREAAARAATEADALDRADAGDLRIGTDGRPVADVVASVLAGVGLAPGDARA